MIQCAQINQASCNIAKNVAKEKGTLVAGGIVQTGVFKTSRRKEDVQDELREGLEVLIQNDIDLIIVEVNSKIKTMRRPNQIDL